MLNTHLWRTSIRHEMHDTAVGRGKPRALLVSARLVFAEVQPPQCIAAKRIFQEFSTAFGTEVETEIARIAIFDCALSRYFHFVKFLRDFLKMIRIEIFFIEFLWVERREDFKPNHIPLVAKLSPAEIAREVQHRKRILPKPESE